MRSMGEEEILSIAQHNEKKTGEADLTSLYSHLCYIVLRLLRSWEKELRSGGLENEMTSDQAKLSPYKA